MSEPTKWEISSVVLWTTFSLLGILIAYLASIFLAKAWIRYSLRDEQKRLRDLPRPLSPPDPHQTSPQPPLDTPLEESRHEDPSPDVPPIQGSSQNTPVPGTSADTGVEPATENQHPTPAPDQQTRADARTNEIEG